MKEKSPALSSPEHEGAGDGCFSAQAFEGLHGASAFGSQQGSCPLRENNINRLIRYRRCTQCVRGCGSIELHSRPLGGGYPAADPPAQRDSLIPSGRIQHCRVREYPPRTLHTENEIG